MKNQLKAVIIEDEIPAARLPALHGFGLAAAMGC